MSDILPAGEGEHDKAAAVWAGLALAAYATGSGVRRDVPLARRILTTALNAGGSACPVEWVQALATNDPDEFLAGIQEGFIRACAIASQETDYYPLLHPERN